LAGEPHREYELIHIARRDVLLRTLHALQELRFAETADRGRVPNALAVRGNSAAQCGNDFFAQRSALGFGTVVKQGDPAGQVIEHEQRARSDIMSFRRGIDHPRAGRQAFESPHQVVTGRPHQTAEQRHARNTRLRLRCLCECRSKCIEQLLLRGRNGSRLPTDRQTLLVEPQLEAVAEPDERIAGQAFAAFDALQ
jgi:hypothetical protein